MGGGGAEEGMGGDINHRTLITALHNSHSYIYEGLGLKSTKAVLNGAGKHLISASWPRFDCSPLGHVQPALLEGAEEVHEARDEFRALVSHSDAREGLLHFLPRAVLQQVLDAAETTGGGASAAGATRREAEE